MSPPDYPYFGTYCRLGVSLDQSWRTVLKTAWRNLLGAKVKGREMRQARRHLLLCLLWHHHQGRRLFLAIQIGEI